MLCPVLLFGFFLCCLLPFSLLVMLSNELFNFRHLCFNEITIIRVVEQSFEVRQAVRANLILSSASFNAALHTNCICRGVNTLALDLRHR